MRNGGGYVRIYRSMLEWEWYDDAACTRIMLHLLLSANWEEKRWHGQTIAAGQLVTSMEGISAKLRLSRSAVRRAFDKLKSTGEIAIQTNNHWTTVTLANWAEYQELPPTNGRQKSRPPTDQRPTTDQPPATTEEEKALKKGRREEENAARAVPVDPRSGFIAACKAVVDANPERLPESLRKEFFDYWTEKDAKGKMRFQAQDFFDHGRRMDTWRKRAEKSGDFAGAEKPPILNANGKPQQLKPWVN